MDAVLPLTLAACPRAAAFLFPSLRTHYRDLGTLWIVSPRQDLDAVKEATRHAGLRISHLADEDVVPEFITHARFGFPRVGGWYRQQLVKLAIAEHIASDFYLTLDDDVFAVAGFADADCLLGGRALRGQDRAGHRNRNLPADSPSNLDHWLTWSARVLQCGPLDYQPDVTPSILSRTVVGDLAKWLEAHVRPEARRWRLASALGALTGGGLQSWRGRLLALLPWTEYTIYDTFLVQYGDFAAWHRQPTDTLLLGNAAWNEEQFAGWQPRALDDLGRRLLFNLVASRSTITVADVAARIGPPAPDRPVSS